MNDYTSAKVFSGASKSLANSINPTVQADKASARLLKAQREEQLANMQSTAGVRKQLNEQEMQIAVQQNSQLLAESARRRTYDGFDRYTGDGDVRHLNVMLQDLKSNPAGAKLFGEWARVDPVTEADRSLFAKNGLDPELFLSNPEVSRGLVKGTTISGEQKLVDLDSLYRSTGYSKYMSDQELKRQVTVASIYKAYRETGAKTALERHIASVLQSEGLEPGTDEYEARRLALWNAEKTKSGTSNKLTSDEREATRRARLRGASPEEFDKVMQEELEAIKKRNEQTAASKDMDDVDTAKQALDDMAGGSFVEFDLDEADPRQYSKVEREVERIERFGKLKFDAADKKELAAIRDLITLGESGIELSPEKVGWFDDITGSVKKYISDDVKGIDATSAYTAYVNTLANALYGSALSAGEMERLNKQFGTLKQQTGPVLAQFRTGLEQLKSRLNNISANSNSYVTHFRLGVNKEQLDTIIGRLDERIKYISGYSPTKPGETPKASTGKSKEDLLNILRPKAQ